MCRVPSTVWLLTAILAVALGVRLGAAAWWQARLPVEQKFAFGDSEGYWELARSIARGRPYVYSPLRYEIFRTPGYPVVLSGLFLIRDEPPVFWGRIVGAILGTAAVAAVAALAWQLFGGRTALIAAAIAAIYPEAIAASVFILSEAPFTPLMVLSLVLWTLAWRAERTSDRAGWALAVGFASGLATLTRPSWLLFVPFAAVIGLLVGGDRKRHALVSGLAVVGLCLTMTPWWVRNALVVGRFVPTTLQVGASLYDGLSPTATGASDMRFVPKFVAEQRAADRLPNADRTGLFEDRLDRRMRDASLAWVRENPARALRLMGMKLVRLWNFWPNAAEFRSRALRVVLAASYLPVIVLAAIGAWRFARRDWPYSLLLLTALYLTCLHVVFVSSLRYRQPAMLALIVLAAAAIVVRSASQAEKPPVA